LVYYRPIDVLVEAGKYILFSGATKLLGGCNPFGKVSPPREGFDELDACMNECMRKIEGGKREKRIPTWKCEIRLLVLSTSGPFSNSMRFYLWTADGAVNAAGP
jgi:hypothetical protein